ncbi:MAG: phytase [Balneolales bacterium]
MTHLYLCQFLMMLILLFSISGKTIAQTVSIDPVFSTEPTAGDADDPAIWIHPTDPERSLIIAMDKGAGVYVYDLTGKEIQHIDQGTAVNNIDLRYGVNLAGVEVDIVAANLRDARKLAVFKINPDYQNGEVLTQIADKNSSDNNIQPDSYGFTLYKRKSDGSLYVFELPKDDGAVRQYLISDDGSPYGISLEAVRDLNYEGGTAEGFVADDDLGYVYITEEGEGIHKYYADPEFSNDRIHYFAENDGIEGDREGLALYACNDGTGYLVLSSQGNDLIKIYERQGANQLVKTIEALDDQGQGNLGTDGLDVNSASIPSIFPNGFLVVHDEDAARYHVYDWANVAERDLKPCPQQR